MNAGNTNEPPDLSPPSKDPAPIEPPLNLPTESVIPATSNNPEVFVNPNPPPTPPNVTKEEEGRIISEGPTKKPRKIPYKIIAGILIVILLVIVGFTVNELFLNRTTTLSLIPDDTEYYLTLAIKEHPQAKKAKELVNKLPASEKIMESLNNYSTELLGPQDPFEDIFRLSKDKIFLAKLYPEADQKNIGLAGINDLLNIVALNRPKDARNELKKLTEGIDLYDTSEQTYNGSAIYNIKLKKKGGSTRSQFDVGPLPSKVTLPLSEGVFATPVKNFILASENVSDVKRSLDLSKVKSLLGFNNTELRSLQEDESHKKLSKYFPKETLVSFYQNQPLSPYGDYLPMQSLGQSFIAPQSVISNPEGRAETFTRVPQGLTITAEDNGMNMTYYQLDIKNPDGSLNNPFKFEESLATKLPAKFSGISPAFYGEAKNYYQVYKDQIDQMRAQAENSDNRTQREQFKSALKSIEDAKKEVRKATGIDYEKDLLAYLDSHVTAIFNAGSAKKSPEFILVAEVKDTSAVEKSLKKFKIPDYIKEMELSTQEGTAKKTVIPPITPKKSTYKKISLYSLSLYEYQKTTLNMYFAASDGKLVILFGTDSQSLKEIFDFKAGKDKSLASGEVWQSQFAEKGEIGGFTYVEPLQFWGIVDYVEGLYPKYKTYVTSDLEVAIKGYLKSLRSIGTVVGKESDVHTTRSFIEIVELPTDEKKKVEDAVQRLLDADRKSGFSSVLGIETSINTLDLWKERLKRLFVPSANLW